MNFGRKGLQDKIDKIESRGSRIGNSIVAKATAAVMLVIVAVVVIGASMLTGMYKGIIDGTPSVSDVNIMPSGYATFIYDSEGNMLQQLNSADGNRISVSIDDIPEDMQHAIIAIEDSRFYEHNGVDAIGMIRAAATAVATGFSRTEGASTITQQLLKNNVFTDFMSESKFERIVRKIQEQHLAVELEKALKNMGEDPKAVVLENYLNTVNFGSGTYGIQAASLKYFGKDCSELTLSECAVLAAIPQNPTKWNPITYPENNAQRRQKVLDDMLEQEWITQEEYDEAVNDDVYSRITAHDQETPDEEEVYSYFVDELITRLKEDLMEIGYTDVQALNAIYSGGLRIYTTMDSRIQNIMEEEFSNEANFPEGAEFVLDWALTVDHEDGERQNYSREQMQKYFRETTDPEFDLIFASEEEAQAAVDAYKAAVLKDTDTIIAERFSATLQPQAAMVIIDQSTGYVKGIVGGRGEKTASLVLNRATDSYRQPGSTFKILSTYGPALEEGKINLATIVKDEPYSYSDGTPVHNADETYRGNVTIREAIRNSINVVAVKTITDLTPQVGFNYLEKMGFKKLINDTSWDVIQPLALGGITNGVSTLELCGAYAAIANDGVYTEPIFYTKVTDQYGNVILENHQQTNRVFSSATSTLLTSAMEDVVQNGTGIDFQIPGMTLAGKTGTTNVYRDLVFAGFTPYYTGAIWAGYDVSAVLPENERNYYKVLWKNVMTRVHEGLADKEFVMSDDVTTISICKDSGKLAGLGCDTITELFDKKHIPTQRCTEHIPTPTPTPEPTPTPTPTPTPEPEEGETGEEPEDGTDGETPEEGTEGETGGETGEEGETPTQPEGGGTDTGTETRQNVQE